MSSSEEKLELLKKLCTENAECFAKDSSENGQRLYISLLSIRDTVEQISPSVTRIRDVAPKYDFDEQTAGNGFRSFVGVFDSAINYAIELNQKVAAKKDGLIFIKNFVAKDIESCAHVFGSLCSCFEHLETLITWNNDGELFPKEDHPPEQILAHSDSINQYCFYGRSLGFQFCESMRGVLQFIALSMAVFSEAYYSEGSLISRATNSILTTTKYFKDPEERAKRIVNISQNADVDFCKAFWFLSEFELMHHLPSVVAQSVAVSKIIELPPEPLTLTIDGKEIQVPVPNSHIGTKPVRVRLISYELREGMIGEAAAAQKGKAQPPARGLLVHCHGGGFVAQSSRSHESYLRGWAKALNVPILSVDYSLAPEAPYPRALEEVLYAYGWALKNCELLGSTGESIVAAGDSAGANLLLAASLRCIDLGLPLPKGLFVAYVPTLIDFIPSPARLLCMMDPLLPFGFLIRCLKAYTSKDGVKKDNNSDSDSFEEISESDLMELQAHKSPISETSDTLTYGSLNSQMEDKRELDVNALESDTETDATTRSTTQTFSENVQNRVVAFISNLKGRFENLMPKKSPSGAVRVLDIERERSTIEEFKNIKVPKDPYISPYLASDAALKQLPPVKILTVQLDPCLDDCVMFAKRLKNLNHNVTLDVLEGLPHGFLNFSLLSKEAMEGSKVCVKKIQELMDLDGLPPQVQQQQQ